MNWSKGAALNSENLNLIVSPEIGCRRNLCWNFDWAISDRARILD
jgi:hypothetical protein